MEESELYNIQTCFNGSRCKLYDLATWKNGAAFKGVKVSPSGKPIIKIAELNNGISESTICTDEQFSEDILLHKGDLVFAWSGNPETSIDIFRYNLTDGWLNQHIFKVTVNEKAIDRDFFFYLMKYIKPNFKKIASNKQTTGLGHVTIADLKAITVTIPNHNLQRHIAEILKSLDDKIELNNRINHNLEQQAQALYKSWFVDFEPFKNGNFIDSELGMIPEGWKTGMLSDLLEVRYGKDHKNLSDGTIPVYGSGGLMRYAEKALFNNESVLIPRKGTLNNVMYVSKPFWTVDTMFYTVEKAINSIKYCHQFLLTQDLASMNAGSAVPSMTTEILNNLKLIIPSDSVLKDFNRVVSSLYTNIECRISETGKLMAYRDSILPKLMSGEELITC